MPFDETFRTQGCLVVDRLFDPHLIAEAHAEYRRQYPVLDLANLPLHMNVGERRVSLPLQIKGALLDPNFYAHPLLKAILSSIMPTPFVIDNVSCVNALPGAGEQKLHRDVPLMFAEKGAFAAGLPAYAVTVAIPLVDLDEETGTTKLFPGSMGALADMAGEVPELGEELCPFVKRGGCFLVDYRLWHRGMANRSDRDRPIVYIVYAREWFTDVNNFKKHARLAIDAADAKAIPAEHRPLFRRVAAKGLHDMSIKELMGEG